MANPYCVRSRQRRSGGRWNAGSIRMSPSTKPHGSVRRLGCSRNVPTERSDDDWLMVKLLLAETYQHMVAAGAEGRDKSELNREARRLAIEVAKYRSDAQDRAQALLAQLGHVTQTVAQTKPMETFDDAMSAARDALSQRQVAAQTGGAACRNDCRGRRMPQIVRKSSSDCRKHRCSWKRRRPLHWRCCGRPRTW